MNSDATDTVAPLNVAIFAGSSPSFVSAPPELQATIASAGRCSDVSHSYTPPLYFAGPGSDPDSIRELNSGATLLWQHRYVLSRPPGYFPYEALCGLLYALGGTIASNLATVAISLLLLDSFLHICEHFEVPHRYLLAATMAIQPVYWASSTSTSISSGRSAASW